MDVLASGDFSPDENAETDGEVVWSWRRDAGAKLCGSVRDATVTRKPAHRGEPEVSRKTTRVRECRDVSRWTRGVLAVCFLPVAHGLRVHWAPGIPHALRGGRDLQNSGASCREDAESCLGIAWMDQTIPRQSLLRPCVGRDDNVTPPGSIPPRHATTCREARDERIRNDRSLVRRRRSAPRSRSRARLP